MKFIDITSMLGLLGAAYSITHQYQIDYFDVLSPPFWRSGIFEQMRNSLGFGDYLVLSQHFNPSFYRFL
jgi:hypothetical protein